MDARMRWMTAGWITLIFFAAVPAVATAGSLGDYKEQKHEKDSDRFERRERHDSSHRHRSRRSDGDHRHRADSHGSGSCRSRAYRKCRSTCNGNQSMCNKHCNLEAKKRCGDTVRRSERRHSEHRHTSRCSHSSHSSRSSYSSRHEHRSSSSSSSFAAFGVVTHSSSRSTARARSSRQAQAQGGVSAEFQAQKEAYQIEWDGFSASAEVGAGMVGEGALGTTGHFRLRYKNFGAGGTITHLADTQDWLSEADVGPAFFVGMPHLVLGAQPSVLVSAGNDVDTLLGGGVRGYARLMVGRLFADFDPMIGYINGQWNYHLRAGVGWRLTPNLHVKAAYDQRDILDLREGVEHVPLRGGFLMVGARFN